MPSSAGDETASEKEAITQVTPRAPARTRARAPLTAPRSLHYKLCNLERGTTLKCSYNYVDDAAELGGGRMLPTLMALTHSPDREFTRINAVTGMCYTGSRTAVPILIEFLGNSDTDISDRARSGLNFLTHRTDSDDSYHNPQSQYPKWSQWWPRESTTAPIYKPTECCHVSRTKSTHACACGD